MVKQFQKHQRIWDKLLVVKIKHVKRVSKYIYASRSLILPCTLYLNIKFILDQKYFLIIIKKWKYFFFQWSHPHLAEPLPPVRYCILLPEPLHPRCGHPLWIAPLPNVFHERNLKFHLTLCIKLNKVHGFLNLKKRMVCKQKKDLINFNLMKNFLKMKIHLSVYRKKNLIAMLTEKKVHYKVNI